MDCLPRDLSSRRVRWGRKHLRGVGLLRVKAPEWLDAALHLVVKQGEEAMASPTVVLLLL